MNEFVESPSKKGQPVKEPSPELKKRTNDTIITPIKTVKAPPEKHTKEKQIKNKFQALSEAKKKEKRKLRKDEKRDEIDAYKSFELLSE
ncbi:hypothetical protein JTB14_020418 [Gonioctena quinquepunctata]|nr:hypothetical protein JTB14_020418 [Gonioctena quinquepunctata]